ncbi:hypothetical protein BASA81_002946 [Batrachochytrium salamandrivorans]|nr:hypothetical protein BASA81_002946 [Batrachochytrium salamandrivorans]
MNTTTSASPPAGDNKRLRLAPPAPDSTTLVEMCKQQLVYAPNAEYFAQQQNQIQPLMRAKLVDWIFHLSKDLRLRRYSTYCGVNFLDRFLSVSSVDRSSLQLVGLAALWMGTKLEERNPPPVSELCENTGITEKQMVQMEATMLAALEWNLMPMTAYSFATIYVQRLIRLCRTEEKEEGDILPFCNPHAVLLSGMMELLDFCLMNHESLAFLPSVLAAAALEVLGERHSLPVALVYSATAEQASRLCSQWLTGVMADGFRFSESESDDDDDGDEEEEDEQSCEIQQHNASVLDLYLAKPHPEALSELASEEWKAWRELARRYNQEDAGGESGSDTLISLDSFSTPAERIENW